MQNYHYSYLVGALIFGAAWLACYLLGKNYRAEIRWGTVISAPMALTSILFVPQYWTPPSLFNLDQKSELASKTFCGRRLWEASLGGGRNPSEGETVGASKSGAPTPLHALHRRRRSFPGPGVLASRQKPFTTASSRLRLALR